MPITYFEWICPLPEQIPEVAGVLRASHPTLSGEDLLARARSDEPTDLARLGLGWWEEENEAVAEIVAAGMTDEQLGRRDSAFSPPAD